MIRVRIYSGEGVSAYFLRHVIRFIRQHYASYNGKVKVSCIRPNEVLKASWEEETDLFIIPGGADRYYHRDLQGEGVERIRSYVAEGGTYLGICAGAYFGAKKIYFEILGEESELIHEDRELCFFPGVAVGPAYGGWDFSYTHYKGVKAVRLGDFSGEEFYALYHGGCFFQDAENFPGIRVNYRYLDLPQAPAAIISCRYGLGRVILSGVHLEYMPQYCLLQEEAVLLAKSILSQNFHVASHQNACKNLLPVFSEVSF